MSEVKGSVVGIIQMTSVKDVDKNLKQVESLVKEAQAKGTKMVFLPESCDFIAENKYETIKMAENWNSVLEKFKEISRKYGMWMSLGGIHEKAEKEEKIYNSHIVLDSNGNLVSKYKKLHLFDISLENDEDEKKTSLQESSYTKPGLSFLSPFSSPVGKIGLAVCYDLRFPELSTKLRLSGAEIITFPSAFTVATGKAHWEVLLRARAIENQCYVVAAAQVGQHNSKRNSFGHSMVVDPWGRIVSVASSDSPQVFFAHIDLELVTKVRKSMPILHHRRSDIYGNLLPGCLPEEIPQCNFSFGKNKISFNHVFLKTSLSFGFVNRSPLVPGHVLICPIKPHPRFNCLSKEELLDLYSCVKLVGPLLEQLFGCSSLTISIQDGEEAGQTVDHLHVHVLPRKRGDFDNNDQIYKELEQHDKKERKWREKEDMDKEALIIRQAINKSLE